MPKVIFEDGSCGPEVRRSFPGAHSIAELVALTAQGAGRVKSDDIIAGKVNGRLVDLSAVAPDDAEAAFVSRDSDDGLNILRHSTAHVMAAAVMRLFKNVKLGFGPAIKEGFYYDFDLPERLNEESLAIIEAEMKKVIAEDLSFERIEIARAEAREKFEKDGQTYKVEWINELPQPQVSIYSIEEKMGTVPTATTKGTVPIFLDLCTGPHLDRTGRIQVFKLLRVAGAYWRGSEERPMLQRIYGTAFWRQEDLDKHLKYLEEVKNRDHRVLGRELAYYSTDEEIGPGLILWHPNGAMVRRIIEDFWYREHLKRRYQLVYTPHMASEAIYQHSGHLENYAENMYGPMEIEKKAYRIKPMNCPGHIKIFDTTKHSYRDLPIRYAELGTVYRYERSGTLQGLLRVRGFTQDDAHIFCTPEQVADEVAGVLELVNVMMRAFKYQYSVYLATMPEKHLGTEEEWTRATNSLKQALATAGLKYEIDEGGGVFYAPKIDVKLMDAIGREWQGPTIQVDLNEPKRFNLNYVGQDGGEHEVVMIHRTVLGSMERFVGGLLEHFAGAMPMWLAPEQVRILTITDAHGAYANKVAAQLREKEIRVAVDLRNEKTGFKIREATMAKIPYVLVVGDNEVRDETVSVRKRGEGNLGPRPLIEFEAAAVAEIAAKT